MSSSEWKEVKLKDLVINYSSKRIPVSSRERESRRGEYPYYGAQGIIDCIDDYIFDGEYLLIAEDGNNLKERKENVAQIAKGKFWVNNHAHVLASNNNSDIRFVKYFLNMTDLSGYITGTAQPKLNRANLESIRMVVPPLEEQKAIANILSSLDEKIELNNQMNKNLEDMARALFKRWFVDFEFPNEEGEPYKSSGGEMVDGELGMVPKGWKVVELEKVCSINPRETIQKGKSIPYVEMANLPTSYARIKRYTNREFSGGTKFRNGDVLFARITPCLENGKTALVDFLEEEEIAFGSTEYIIIRPKKVGTYYLYCLSRFEQFRNYGIKCMNGTSGRQRVDAAFVKAYQLPIPDDDNILIRFEDICKRIFAIMKQNDENSIILEEIRDTLLPKLMSGEIRVKDLQI